ncbi:MULTISPECIES: phosphoribosylglycinamide formyltransferase [Flavobacterium]|uniref:Phosphoribosylglycinamide formyltransferase n=1 Tax=Flavobacterium columnare TaxID=996 RepID=A0AA94JP47_9FLAO|nr:MULTISPECIES: phosphoribosylglycinamide formyltransferase [Flavobacterium]OXA82770.1 phosphoribosylglycinamide formyltransferase [Flavobacterium columnare NBRC 100251 = ATCC 23463]AMA48163.1 phosphoribosylglycinamide formyltransferase [Flavobacterium covae]AND63699.1 phosphoribosylglycinamide formyltransferase [Flavobacterium covae]MCH4830075.1 phosphoribosylglycinamide formyltransferase [Flavobacterium columnare]MCH4832545.1 phosphoribosylglycinamide formyltransferase [Flavobacterium colum
MKKIAIFASGSGSNAEKIILYFKNSSKINVVQVYSNNPKAKVLDRAKNHKIPTSIFTKEELNTGFVLKELKELKPDLIVLAGFLLKFPENIINAYPNQVINIHPALLPKYGGKGMYGMNVHEAVLKNKEKETGITIHYVNEHYDEGAIIAQYSTNIENYENAEKIAMAVHLLEHTYFSVEIEKLLNF